MSIRRVEAVVRTSRRRVQSSDAGNICLHIPFIPLCMVISALNNLSADICSIANAFLDIKLLTCAVLQLVALRLQAVRNLTAGDLRHGRD